MPRLTNGILGALKAMGASNQTAVQAMDFIISAFIGHITIRAKQDNAVCSSVLPRYLKAIDASLFPTLHEVASYAAAQEASGQSKLAAQSSTLHWTIAILGDVKHRLEQAF